MITKNPKNFEWSMECPNSYKVLDLFAANQVEFDDNWS